MKRLSRYFQVKLKLTSVRFLFYLSYLPSRCLLPLFLSFFFFVNLSLYFSLSTSVSHSLSLTHSLSLSSLPYSIDFNRVNVFLFTYYFCIFFTCLLFFFLSIELHTECIVRARRALFICPSHFEAESVLGMSLEKKGMIPTCSLYSCSISFSPSLCYDPL